MRKCQVFIHGKDAGILKEDTNGYEFSYNPSYLMSENPEPVSLSLPIREGTFRSPYLFPAFSSILSEGETRQLQAKRFNVDPEDDFSILMLTCRFDTIGAITVKPL